MKWLWFAAFLCTAMLYVAAQIRISDAEARALAAESRALSAERRAERAERWAETVETEAGMWMEGMGR